MIYFIPAGTNIVVSPGSAVGVGVAVVLVVGVLITLVVVLALRHRRLSRPFLSFANSRYSHARGTTLISTNELGEL